MTFWQLIVFEGLLLLAAGMTIIAGIRGIIGATLILSSLIGLAKPDKFWNWEIPFLIGAIGGVVLLLYFSKKAEESQWITGLAGGIMSFVVFGAFLTPMIAVIISALFVGTGLIPPARGKQIFWGFIPVLWRTCLGITWIILGNILV